MRYINKDSLLTITALLLITATGYLTIKVFQPTVTQAQSFKCCSSGTCRDSGHTFQKDCSYTIGECSLRQIDQCGSVANTIGGGEIPCGTGECVSTPNSEGNQSPGQVDASFPKQAGDFCNPSDGDYACDGPDGPLGCNKCRNSFRKSGSYVCNNGEELQSQIDSCGGLKINVPPEGWQPKPAGAPCDLNPPPFQLNWQCDGPNGPLGCLVCRGDSDMVRHAQTICNVSPLSNPKKYTEVCNSPAPNMSNSQNTDNSTPASNGNHGGNNSQTHNGSNTTQRNTGNTAQTVNNPYGATSFTCAGDFDGNNRVNLRDFAFFVAHYRSSLSNQTNSALNLDMCHLDLAGNDCSLELNDFAVFMVNYNHTCSGERLV